MSPLVLRLLAFAAAVAMVVGALIVRNRMDTDEVTRSTNLELLCASELEEVCLALEDDPDSSITAVIQSVGTTVDQLVAADRAEFDGWLTPGPFPQIVRETRKAAQKPVLIDNVSRPLARSRLALVMWKERAAALAGRCADRAVELKCLGEAAGRPWKDVGGSEAWGFVKTALPDPGRTAAGLVALGAGTSTYFGQPDVGRLEIDENDNYGVWFENLVQANVAIDLSGMLAGGPSRVDAVAGLEAAVRPVVGAAANADAVSVIYPSPVATADVYLGTIDSDQGARLTELLTGELGRTALSDAGWTLGDAGLPPVSYLPTPGLLSVLRDRWAQ